jgi:hypothetical protein
LNTAPEPTHQEQDQKIFEKYWKELEKRGQWHARTEWRRNEGEAQLQAEVMQ